VRNIWGEGDTKKTHYIELTKLSRFRITRERGNLKQGPAGIGAYRCEVQKRKKGNTEGRQGKKRDTTRVLVGSEYKGR